MAKTRRKLYNIVSDGKVCPICKYPLGISAMGEFCQNAKKMNCFYVDGMAALTAAQAKKFKNKINKLKNIQIKLNYGAKSEKY